VTGPYEDQFDHVDDHSHLATELLLGLVDPELDRLTPARFRPVFALVIGTELGGQKGPKVKVLCNWVQLAVLYGQLRASRVTLPVHVCDQWDKLEGDAYRSAMVQVEHGRPTGG
jgi:hypothetical protein